MIRHIVKRKSLLLKKVQIVMVERHRIYCCEVTSSREMRLVMSDACLAHTSENQAVPSNISSYLRAYDVTLKVH